MRKAYGVIAIGGFVVVLGLPGAAYAYVDPTTGGYLLQILLGGAGGLYVLFRIVGSRILSFFRKKKGNGDAEKCETRNQDPVKR